MNVKFKLLLALLLAAVCHTPIAAAEEVLRETISVPAPQGLTLTQLDRVVRWAALDSEWTVDSSTPGILDLHINVRDKHEVWVTATYDVSQVNITYKASRDLDHRPCGAAERKEGKLVYPRFCIHDQYENWVVGLLRRLEVSRQKLIFLNALGE